MMHTFKFLVLNFKQYRWHVALLSVLGFISSVLGGLGVGAVIPLFSSLTGDSEPSDDPVTAAIIRITPYLPWEGIYAFLALIVFIFLLRTAALVIFGIVRARILYEYKVRTINDLFTALIRARWPFLLTQKAGYMQNILVRDSDKSADLLDALSYLPFALISVLVFLSFALTISFEVTLIAFFVGVAVVFVVRPLLKRLKAVNTSLAAQNKVVSQFIIEHLIGIKNIKAGARAENVLQKSRDIFVLWKGTEMKAKVLAFFNKHFIEPVSILFVVGAIAIAYNTPGFRIETFAVTLLLIQRAFVYMQQVQSSLYGLVEALPYATQAYAFRDDLRHHGEREAHSHPFRFQKAISFEGVRFAYHPGKPVLSGVNFVIQKGETVGLIGPSGVGKTSVADLLMRLFEPVEGSVRLDGIEASEFDIQDWRGKIGYVSQDVFLLNDTVAENIRFYHDHINEGVMIEAAREANIHDTIKGLPNGFNTIVGDRGVMLSAGQRQRIVLARALVRNPEMLILDEATSALDNESETLIQKAIHNLRGKMTIFMIAHRLSTVMNVDRLLVLDHEKIIEEGKPADLLQNEASYFYRMYHMKEA